MMSGHSRLTLIAQGSTKWQRLIKRWGISYLLNDNILFDAFGDADYFLGSLARIKTDISKICHIVISHDHWDHLTGLWPLLERHKCATVYICPGFRKITKEKLLATGVRVVEVHEAREIRNGIYTTGPIQGIYENKAIEEQAIIVKSRQGLALITGCAHPGIVNILNKVMKDFGQPVIWVIGGLHLKNVSREEIKGVALKLKESGVKKVAPLHCTGAVAQQIFRNTFREDVFRLKEREILFLDK